MQNFARRLMSGASLALLAFGAPSIARATSGANFSNFQVKSGVTSAVGQGTSDLWNAAGPAGEDVIYVDEVATSALDTAAGNAGNVDGYLFGEGGRYWDAVGNAHSAGENFTGFDLPYGLTGAKTYALDIADSAYTFRPSFPSHPTNYHSANCCGTAHVVTAGLWQGTAPAHLEIATNVDFIATANAHNATRVIATAYGAHQKAAAFGSAANLFVNNTNGVEIGIADAHNAATATAHAFGIHQSAGAAYSALNFVSNEAGFIGAAAHGYSAVFVSANATAVRQSAIAPFGTAVNIVDNSAAIRAYADANSDAYGHARAVGVLQDPSAQYATNSVVNHGTIYASAFEYNLNAGHATAIGVSQEAEGSISGHNIVTNTGEIAAIAQAQNYFFDYAYANAVGVAQFASAPFANNTVNNSGLILAGAFAYGTGTNYVASAHATGVYQDALGALPANVVNNNGAIIAVATARNADFDYAHAVGVAQYADAATAYNTVVNNNSILAVAVAHNGTTADAFAEGVGQKATSAASANNAVFNNGGIDAYASAHNAAFVNAYAIAVGQSAQGTDASNYVSNDGYILAGALADDALGAHATAIGVGQYASADFAHNAIDNYNVIAAIATADSVDADAHAKATAVFQEAHGGSSAANVVDNYGFIGASANAYDAGYVSAIAVGVHQTAEAAYAANTVFNGSNAQIVAFAHATNAYSAYAHASGVEQYAHSANTAGNLATNSGLIGGQAVAHGRYAYLDHAEAGAEGIDQGAYADSSAHNAAYNNGTVVALASASYAHYVSAAAVGIHQDATADSGFVAGNFASNNGMVFASALADKAANNGGGGTADAYATGIAQYADDAFYAINTVDNHGTVVALASARSAVYNYAFAAGIDQTATDAFSAVNNVSNTGFIAAAARAAGNDGFTDARYATASAYGIEQNADSTYAANSVRNYGTVVALASATVADTRAKAVADGIAQNASAYYTANNYVSNTGIVWASAKAHNAYNVTALAKGIDQRAYSTSEDAHNNLYNTGVVVAEASASDAEYAHATAGAVRQRAYAYYTASNSVDNTGLLYGDAYAHNAYAGHANAYGVQQLAEGRSGVSASYAYNHVHNGGTIAAFAGVTDVDYAYAHAVGVSQEAYASKVAQNTLTNSGHILADAFARSYYTANAEAVGVYQSADAKSGTYPYDAYNTAVNGGVIAAVATAEYANRMYADAYALSQLAYGSTVAANFASNDGLIVAVAHAYGSGRTGLNYGDAQASGVYQYASASYTDASNRLVNKSNGAIVAIASVTDANSMHAYAYGAYQSAYANGASTATAKNVVTNSGVIAGMAHASPNHSGYHYWADAHAYGVYQEDSALLAQNSVDNHGVIFAGATANGAYYNYAHAFGVYQSANGSTAENAVVNGSNAAIVAVADAYSGEYNEAYAYGVSQNADADTGLVASNRVTNSGLIAAGAYAYDGYDVSAYAGALDQAADPAALASNVAINNGIIVAQARATAASYAYASALDVYQVATGTATARNSVQNHDLMVAAATATAYYTVTANAYGAYQKAYADYTSGNASNALYNSGLIAAAAKATNYSTDVDANALASAVYQSATASNYAHNVVTNEDGAILAYANARALSANAYATARGVDQYADGFTAENTVNNYGYHTTTNGGHVNYYGVIGASAVASGFYNASADARAVEQSAYGYIAGNHVDNDGGLIFANAVARGFTTTNAGIITASRSATLAVAHAAGVSQYADASYAYNDVYNSGTIVAMAAASHFDYQGYATATGVGQSDYAYVGSNYVTNDGGKIIADAKVRGGTFTSASTASANAYGVRQYVDASYGYNQVSNDGLIAAHATASNAGNAYALAHGVDQSVTAYYHAENYAVNYGTIVADAAAHTGFTQRYTYTSPYGTGYATYTAVYGGHATARAVGINQFARANATSATAYNDATNYGVIAVSADAHDAHTAYASAVGVAQEAIGSYASNYAYNNDGVIVARAHASDAPGYTTDVVYHTSLGAVITTTSTYHTGSAHAYAAGIEQVAYAGRADNTAYNSGVIEAFAYASNDSKDYALASAVGISQAAYGSAAHNYADNDGLLWAEATVAFAGVESAYATGIRQAAYGATAGNTAKNDDAIYALAYAYDAVTYEDARAIGMEQLAFGSHASNVAENYGYIDAGAFADKASAASAFAGGIVQFAVGSTVDNYASNTGYMDAHAYASASHVANATALGIVQVGFAFTAYDRAYNSGAIYANASAYASASQGGLAEANASAVGIAQGFLADTAYVTDTNYGRIDAHARASATEGDTQIAAASAAGIAAVGYARAVNVDIYNDGSVTASATAHVATGSAAYAVARGILVENLATGTSAGAVHGLIKNAGNVRAEASAPGGSATAIGIDVVAKVFDGSIVNSGVVDAQAFGAHHVETGIGVYSNGAVASSAAVGHIVNNGGMIFASGGDTEAGNIHQIGNAINVSGAPNEVDITLEGVSQTGQIFGNIEDSENAANWTNTITVKNGTTYFDGSINPGLVTLANGGNLSVSANGTLWLADAARSFWGASPVLNVANYNQAGTLEVGITYGGSNATINAVSATLGGNLVVDLNPYVLFNNSTYNIVNAGSVSGTWSSPVSVMDGAVGTGSPLVSASAVYTGTTAGVNLVRAAFYAPINVTLTSNELAVGHGLENAYSTGLTGGAKDFYLSLFQFNATQYPQALNMLSDSQAGVVAQSNVASASGFVDRIQDRMSSMAAIGQSGAGPQGITLWVTPFGTWTNTSSNASGPGYSDSRAGASVGADFRVDGDALLLGIAGNIEGKGSFQFKDNNWNTLTSGGSGSSSGWDIAGYARYTAPPENDSFYLQGSVSYGTYDDTTNRVVTLPLLVPTSLPSEASPSRASLPPYTATTISTPSLMSGKFTSDVWSVHGEAGLPLDLGDPNFGFTPFVAVRYLHSSSGAFSEKSSNATPGVAAAALNVTDATASTLETYLGTQLNSQITLDGGQMLMPSLRLAWAHNFEDPWKVNGYFQGLGTTSAFEVNSSTWSRDSGLVDLAVSMAFQGNLMATIGYSANFGSTQTTQSVYGRLDVKF